MTLLKGASFLCVPVLYSLFLLPSPIKCSDFIHPPSNLLRGALVDSYQRQVLIIKLKSPSDVLKDSIAKLDTKSMSQDTTEELLRTLGNVEIHYQKQFSDTLAYNSELIASPYPVETTSGNGQIIDLSQIKRSKRQVWRALFSFMKFARPATRISGKLTKYGKFLKAAKYTGYAFSAAVFGYELADIFGAIPDHRYNELSRQLTELHNNRVQDLVIMKNITLLALNTQKTIQDLTSEVDRAIYKARNTNEISILISQIFSSYLQQISNGILLLFQGKIPTFILSLETQIKWLETQLPSPLLTEISSITPHLTVSLKGIDSENNQLIILIEVPQVSSSFQILNFVEWEPELFVNNTCYTSPRKLLYLAFPPTNDKIISNPLIVDPDSCQSSGYIMCETDSVLDHIPDLSENRICTSLKKNRIKREATNFFEQAVTPSYDITRVLKNTLENKNIKDDTTSMFNDLLGRIDVLVKEAEDQKEKSMTLLRGAQEKDLKIKLLFILIIPLVLIILTVMIFILIKSVMTKRKERLVRQENDFLIALKKIQSPNP